MISFAKGSWKQKTDVNGILPASQTWKNTEKGYWGMLMCKHHPEVTGEKKEGMGYQGRCMWPTYRISRKHG
jgi:hypothetical protein